jgi:hypothetical protein
MKKIAFFILLSMMTTFAWAQTAQNTMIEYNKVRVPGVVISITNYDAATVQAALQARMERIGGLKGTNVNGFRLYGGQIFADFGNTKYDTYARVVPGNKKNKDVIINLMVSLGHENFISSISHPELMQKMTDFLTDFVATSLKEYDKNQKVSAQSKDLEKLEKEYKKLVSNRDKLRNNLEKQEKAVATKATEIETVRATLGILKQ